MKKAILFGLLALAIVVAAGCGGGKARNKAYVASKDDYAAALDQICGPAVQKIKAIEPTSLAGIVTAGPQIQDIIGDAVDRIDDLEPPPEVKNAAQDFVDASDEQVDKLGELVDAAKDGDTNRAQELGGELQQLDERTDQDAREIGAQACVSPE